MSFWGNEIPVENMQEAPSLKLKHGEGSFYTVVISSLDRYAFVVKFSIEFHLKFGGRATSVPKYFGTGYQKIGTGYQNLVPKSPFTLKFDK